LISVINFFTVFCTAIVLAIALSIKRIREKVKIIDLYSSAHNYGEGEVMIIRNTLCGGIISIMFIITSFLITIASVIFFTIDNVSETKALVPLVSIDNEIDKIQGDLLITVNFGYYGGKCIENNECSSKI